MSISPRRGKKSPPPKSPEIEPNPKLPPKWADANSQAVLEAAPDAMLVVNRAGEIVTANLQAQKLYGYSREHLIGGVVESLVPARLRDRHRQHRENFFANPEAHASQVLEIFALRSDACEIPVDVSLGHLSIGSETFVISTIRDATERRRIEGLKASAERRGRLVQNSSVAMVVTHGLEHKVELLNDKFSALLGYTIDDIPDVAHWWPLAYPDEAYRQAVRSEWETRTEKALRDRMPFAPMEVTVRCKDGSTVHLEVHLSTLAGDTNLVTFIDLTERKLGEEAIRESEKRYRRIVETTNEGVWLLDSNFHTCYVNRQMEEMLGYEPGEMVGRSAFDFYFPVDFEHKQQVLKRRQQGVREQIEERLRRRDGSELWVRMGATPIVKDTGEFDGALAMVSDITERKRAEEALKKSEEKFSKAFQRSPLALTLTSAIDHCYIDVNETFERLSGWRRDEIIGRTPFDIGLWVDPAERVDIAKRIQTDGYLQYMEVQFRMKDGSIRTGLVSGEAIELDGQPCILGVAADITERKRAEEALRESEERFRLAAQAGKMYAYEWDVATNMIIRSPEYMNILGFGGPAKQLTRQQILDRVHPDDHALLVGSVDRLTPANPTTQISYRMLRPDGAVIWLETSGRAFFDTQGKLVRMIGMVADITEHKRTEEALRESEDKLRLLLDSTAEAIYGIDLEHRCTFCNAACLRSLGYEHVDEVLGKNMHDLIHHTRPDGTLLPVEECRVHRVSQTGEGVHSEDEVLWRANGTSFPAEYWSYPQRRGQKLVGAVVAFIDITQRKQAEAALASVSRKLIEAQEQERTRIGRELHDDIGQRLALLAVQLQQLHEDTLILPEVRSRMGEFQKQISEIAADIQSLSHELHSAKLQYLGIASAMRGFCKEFGQQQKVEIDFQTHDLPSPVPPDTALCFFRVLQEALHNSAKHSGVRHFEVQLWGTSDEIHLTVRDSGVGFDREAAKQSRGLGLISMEERLKLVNGTLSIESQPKSGTTIHARVPLSSGSDSMAAAG